MLSIWCSRCLNNCLEVPNMMRSFSGGAPTPLVVKSWTKQPWWKIENSRDFDHDFALSRGQIRLWLFYTFFSLWSKDSTQKFQVILNKKNRRCDGDFRNFRFFFNFRESFFRKCKITIKMTWDILCRIMGPQWKKV